MYFYLNYLKLKLELKIQKKEFKIQLRIFDYPRIVFHVKYNFYDTYPDKDILAQSKKYDRLIPVFYLHFALIVVLFLIVIYSQ